MSGADRAVIDFAEPQVIAAEAAAAVEPEPVDSISEDTTFAGLPDGDLEAEGEGEEMAETDPDVFNGSPLGQRALAQAGDAASRAVLLGDAQLDAAAADGDVEASGDVEDSVEEDDQA